MTAGQLHIFLELYKLRAIFKKSNFTSRPCFTLFGFTAEQFLKIANNMYKLLRFKCSAIYCHTYYNCGMYYMPINTIIIMGTTRFLYLVTDILKKRVLKVSLRHYLRYCNIPE